jgi:hypothetical protein
LALVVVTSAAMGGVLRNEFSWWDDHDTIHHNSSFNPPSGKAILEYWKKPSDGLYVPVTHSLWGGLAFLAEMKGTNDEGIHLNAQVYHAASLVLHIVAVLVLFRILLMLCGHVWPACAGAMLFALHPVQVETVAWASGMKDLLFGMLSICAIHQYVVFARAKRAQEDAAAGSTEPVKTRAWFYFVTGMLALVLALLSKPTAVVVPAIVAVLDWAVIRRHWKKVAVSAGIWAAAALPFAIAARMFQDAWRVPPVSWWHKPFIAGDALAFYLLKLVWPVGLAPDYGRRPTAVIEMWGGAWMHLIWIVPAMAALWVWMGRRTRPWVAVGAVVFLAVLAPVLGLTPFMFQYTSTVADHYLYLAMFGPALVLAWALVRYRWRIAQFACGAGLVVLGVLSMLQTRVWREDLELWSHNVRVVPQTFTAHNNLAAALGRRAANAYRLIQVAKDKSDIAQIDRLEQERRAYLRLSVAELRRAIDVNPDYITAYRNAYINSMRLGDDVRATYYLEQLLRCSEAAPPHLRENFIPFRELAARLNLRLENYEKAAQHYEEILRQAPQHKTARAHLDGVRRKMAEARIE